MSCTMYSIIEHGVLGGCKGKVGGLAHFTKVSMTEIYLPINLSAEDH